jgi:hypothetical protein
MSPEQRTFGGAPEGAPPEYVEGVNFEQDENGEVDGSLLSRLRHAAAEQSKEHVKDFMVGGEFRKELWIRYKPLDSGPMDRFLGQRSKMRDLAESDKKSSLPLTELNMDLMAHACVAVVGADVNGENKEILEDDFGPVKLEHRLAELLGFPIPGEKMLTAREVIMLVFGNNAVAIIDHGDEVLAWMHDPVEGIQPGES